MKRTIYICGLAVLAMELGSGRIFSQGSLTPPGAPAPTMKSLSQVEPRFWISSAPTNLTVSGSYYLTTNLVGSNTVAGITVLADNVTLDLNGFALIGVPGSLDGIICANNNLTVYNGTIRDWSGAGIQFSGGNGQFRQLHFYHNSAGGTAIAGNSLITGCTVRSNAAFGLRIGPGCEVSYCTIAGNQGEGIGQLVFGGSGQLVNNTIIGCNIYTNSSSGLQASGNCLVLNNNFVGNGGGGIFLIGTGCRIEGNNFSANAIAAISNSGNGTNNLIIRNSAHNNAGVTFPANGANTVGPLVTSTTILTNNNPHANYSY